MSHEKKRSETCPNRNRWKKKFPSLQPTPNISLTTSPPLKNYVSLFCPHSFFLIPSHLHLHVALHSQGGNIIFSNLSNNTNITSVEGLVQGQPPQLPGVWTDPLWTVPVAQGVLAHLVGLWNSEWLDMPLQYSSHHHQTSHFTISPDCQGCPGFRA